jgi:calcineurin-like phosphoesterase family protein
MVKITTNTQIWFTSDHHFGHENIIKYCSRPFQSVEEMNLKMIENWNQVIPHDGIVFHLGDFAYGGIEFVRDIRAKLNGTIHFVRGNHDKIQDSQLLTVFKTVNDIARVKVIDPDVPEGIQRIELCHYPFKSWNGSFRGSWHLYGHCHQNLPEDSSFSFDIGVDGFNFTPVSYEQVKTKMNQKQS